MQPLKIRDFSHAQLKNCYNKFCSTNPIVVRGIESIRRFAKWQKEIIGTQGLADMLRKNMRIVIQKQLYLNQDQINIQRKNSPQI